MTFVGDALGCMYAAPSYSGDEFYTRTLLTVVQGPVSFAYLPTVDGVTHRTYRDACITLGIVANDDEWVLCLQGAVATKTGHQLCRLFVVILTACAPGNPMAL